jgi:hypothetical protein
MPRNMIVMSADHRHKIIVFILTLDFMIHWKKKCSAEVKPREKHGACRSPLDFASLLQIGRGDSRSFTVLVSEN